GIALAGAGMLWSDTRRARQKAALVAATLVLLTAANYSGRLIDVVYAKGKFRDPAWVEFARWNALSRVEVDNQGQAKVIVIDADASTYIMNADLSRWHGTAWERALMSAPPALANVLRPHGEFAIIGPGGGVDVLRAVANGSPSVTGIEINPIIATSIMRGAYADYSFHLYDRPEVHLHVTDGRSFVRNAHQQFDVVQLTLVDTWASTAAGAFALSENSLYTVDAFREYFEHLKPDGMIAITRWEFRQPREALRVVSVATEALHQLGVQNRAKHFIVVSEGDLDEDGIPVVVLGIVFAISLVAVAVFLVGPMALRGGRRQRALPLLYFVAVGLGYILVEIAFIQRFVLFLGHPTYALTVVIFLLLLSSGAGSLASRRWLSSTGRGWQPLVVIAAAILLYVFVLPLILSSLVVLPFAIKLLVSAVLLVPLGFAMGMPFPTGLHALAGAPVPTFPASSSSTTKVVTNPAEANAVEWAWALNAASSVLGSVLAMVIAIHFGMNVTLTCGAAAYLLALAL